METPKAEQFMTNETEVMGSDIDNDGHGNGSGDVNNDQDQDQEQDFSNASNSIKPVEEAPSETTVQPSSLKSKRAFFENAFKKNTASSTSFNNNKMPDSPRRRSFRSSWQKKATENQASNSKEVQHCTEKVKEPSTDVVANAEKKDTEAAAQQEEEERRDDNETTNHQFNVNSVKTETTLTQEKDTQDNKSENGNTTTTNNNNEESRDQVAVDDQENQETKATEDKQSTITEDTATTFVSQGSVDKNEEETVTTGKTEKVDATSNPIDDSKKEDNAEQTVSSDEDATQPESKPKSNGNPKKSVIISQEVKPIIASTGRNEESPRFADLKKMWGGGSNTNKNTTNAPPSPASWRIKLKKKQQQANANASAPVSSHASMAGRPPTPTSNLLDRATKASKTNFFETSNDNDNNSNSSNTTDSVRSTESNPRPVNKMVTRKASNKLQLSVDNKEDYSKHAAADEDDDEKLQNNSNSNSNSNSNNNSSTPKAGNKAKLHVSTMDEESDPISAIRNSTPTGAQEDVNELEALTKLEQTLKKAKLEFSATMNEEEDESFKKAYADVLGLVQTKEQGQESEANSPQKTLHGANKQPQTQTQTQSRPQTQPQQLPKATMQAKTNDEEKSKADAIQEAFHVLNVKPHPKNSSSNNTPIKEEHRSLASMKSASARASSIANHARRAAQLLMEARELTQQHVAGDEIVCAIPDEGEEPIKMSALRRKERSTIQNFMPFDEPVEPMEPVVTEEAQNDSADLLSENETTSSETTTEEAILESSDEEEGEATTSFEATGEEAVVGASSQTSAEETSSTTTSEPTAEEEALLVTTENNELPKRHTPTPADTVDPLTKSLQELVAQASVTVRYGSSSGKHSYDVKNELPTVKPAPQFEDGFNHSSQMRDLNFAPAALNPKPEEQGDDLVEDATSAPGKEEGVEEMQTKVDEKPLSFDPEQAKAWLQERAIKQVEEMEPTSDETLQSSDPEQTETAEPIESVSTKPEEKPFVLSLENVQKHMESTESVSAKQEDKPFVLSLENVQKHMENNEMSVDDVSCISVLDKYKKKASGSGDDGEKEMPPILNLSVSLNEKGDEVEAIDHKRETQMKVDDHIMPHDVEITNDDASCQNGGCGWLCC